MSEGRKRFDDEKQTLLENLAAQYKLYREEVRIYMGFAAASSSLLVLLLFSLFTAAKGTDKTPPNSEMYTLIPLSLIWYSAIFALFMSHVVVIEEYSELLERKMNALLNYDMFQFESEYKFPSWKTGDIVTFLFFIILIGIVPIGLTVNAGYKALVKGYAFSRVSGGFILVGYVTVFIVEYLLVYRVRTVRRKRTISYLLNGMRN